MSKKRAPLTGHNPEHASMEEQIEAALQDIEFADERLKQNLATLRVQAVQKGRVIGLSTLGLVAAAWLLVPRRALRNGLTRAKRMFAGGAARPSGVSKSMLSLALTLGLPLLHARLTTKQHSPDEPHKEKRSAKWLKVLLDLALPLLFRPRATSQPQRS